MVEPCPRSCPRPSRRGPSRAAGRLAASVVTAVVTVALAGCGYTLQGGGSVLPPDVKKVYVPTVVNNTTESFVTNLVTEALRDRFDRFGVLTVVDSLGEADAVLEVKILRIRRGTRTSTSTTNFALQLDAELELSGELRKVTGEVLWKEPALAITRAFNTSSGAVVTSSADFADSTLGSSDVSALNQRELARNQEQQALSTVAELAAKRIYDDAVAPDF